MAAAAEALPRWVAFRPRRSGGGGVMDGGSLSILVTVRSLLIS